MARRNGNTGAAQAAPTLDELGARIRARMEESEQLTHRTDRMILEHALEVGALLNQVKGQVPKGEWWPWLKKNFSSSRWTANRYMLLASNRARVHSCKSLKEGLAAVKPHKPSQASPKKRPRESGKRLRALHAKRRQGDDSTLMNMRVRVQQVVSVLEGVGLDEYGVEGADDETITEVHEELTMLAVWLEKSLTVLDSHISRAVRVERIRRLREDTSGRSPAEIETARRLADRLERKHLVAV